MLMERGLILRKGTIVDSAIFSTPSSSKNKEKERDPDAHQTDSGIVLTVKASAANETDVSQLMYGEESILYGDVGYLGVE